MRNVCSNWCLCFWQIIFDKKNEQYFSFDQLDALHQKEYQVNVYRCIVVRMCCHFSKVKWRQVSQIIYEAFNVCRMLANIRMYAVSFRVQRHHNHQRPQKLDWVALGIFCRPRAKLQQRKKFSETELLAA